MKEKPQSKLRKNPEPPPQGLKAVALWQWGLLFIIAGLLANQVAGFVMPAAGNSAEARGQAFGRGLAALLFVIAGVVMIVLHFARRERR